MNGAEFRAIRLELGLSPNALARKLGVLSGRTVKRIEASETVSGPLSLAIAKLRDDAGKETNG